MDRYKPNVLFSDRLFLSGDGRIQLDTPYSNNHFTSFDTLLCVESMVFLLQDRAMRSCQIFVCMITLARTLAYVSSI